MKPINAYSGFLAFIPFWKYNDFWFMIRRLELKQFVQFPSPSLLHFLNVFTGFKRHSGQMRPQVSHHPSWLWFQKINAAHVYCPQSGEGKDINMSREHERRWRRRRRAGRDAASWWDNLGSARCSNSSNQGEVELGLLRFFDSGKSRLTRCWTHTETHSKSIHLCSSR